MRLWNALLLGSLSLTSASAIIKRDPSYPDYSKIGSCPGYKVTDVYTTPNGLQAKLNLGGKACKVYGDDLVHLTLEVTYETDERLHVKIQDQGNQVYQVPESVVPRPGGKSLGSSSKLKFTYTKSPFTFKVSRRDTGEVLFDTSSTPLIFESQYLHLRTKLPSDPYLYGLGEHSDPLRLNTNNYIRTLWNQDSFGVPANSNLYGAHPFYLEQRESGAHGVFFLNSNGMDVMISKDASGQQYLEYNTIGGVFDFYFLAGTTPTAVTQQYTDMVGRPAMQPYWGLGFHQCRYGYRDIYEVAEVVHNYSAAGIPLETQWSDIDYMDRRRTFSLDQQRYPIHKVRELVDYLHKHDQHYVVMVDPAVAYQNYDALNVGLQDNIFLLRNNGTPWLGVVWPGVTVFPDWFAENITQYWNGQFNDFFNKDTGVDIDALWIDMNEPSNFKCNFPCNDPFGSAVGTPPAPPPVRNPPRQIPGFPCDFQPEGCSGKRGIADDSLTVEEAEPEYLPPDLSLPHLQNEARAPGAGDQKGLPGRDLLYPKYAIHNKAAFMDSWNADKGGISNHTVNTNVIAHNGLATYDTKNLYGAMMSSASLKAMEARRPGLRAMIITRSTFSGSGKDVGHWLGDNISDWPHYRVSIRSMLAFTSLYGFNMVGSDVCGFNGNTTEELCARWAMLGAFSTFYRNHKDLGSSSQEFYRWPTVAAAAKKAIDIRYRLMDYIYTAMYKASQDGTPALSPMLHIYPGDKNAWPLELQYFYGPGLMVAPVTQQGATSVSVYLPNDVFYDWYTHERIRGSGASITVSNQTLSDIPLYIRGGVIMPLRAKSAMTTTKLRKQQFELLVPCDNEGRAKGELYVDDGVSVSQAKGFTYVQFSYDKGSLSVSGTFNYGLDVAIKKVTLVGCPAAGRTAASGGKGAEKTVDISLNKGSTTFVG